jgi:formylglycine-generating enzyme required for sulfatase activity
MRACPPLLAGAAALLACLSTPAAGQAVEISTLLTRTMRYVGEFVYRFSNVVAEETYLQETVSNRVMPLGAGAMQGLATSGSRRTLKSDFLLVRLPDSDEYLPFRDVFEVDGSPVRDREQRLTTLFLESRSNAVEQARQISLESARYNLGNLARTFNNPIVALAFLQASSQARFRFSIARQDRSAGANVWIVDYREQARPTVIQGQRGRDIPARGQFWIDADSGRVLKSTISLNDPAVVATLTTTYRADDRFQIDVPVEMKEQYAYGSTRVVGTASYGRFRRFDVTTDESLGPSPTMTMTDRRTGLTMVEVPPGTFTMGSPPNEPGRTALERPHQVTITRPFYLGQHEVTQQEWRAVVGEPSSHFADCGPRCPAETVSYDDVQRFLAAINQAPSPVEFVYRLPTEAEWEYVCRAGTTTPFGTGDTITTLQANFNGREPYGASAPGLFRERPVRAGGFAPGPWGLADMHGNVAEWTSDWFEAYAAEADTDPRGPASGELRAVRGGSWASGASAVRCAVRAGAAPTLRDSRIGFRVAADRPGAAR